MGKLSIIISAYDQPEVTAVHVRECMRGTVVPDEIIVVNDNGAPALKGMLQDLEKNTKIIYAWINENIPWNYTGARNLGVWLSTGDFVSIEDCDNIPSTKAYEKALEVMEKNPDVGRVLYGRRPKVLKADLLSKPIDECPRHGMRPTHQDTQLLRREVYLKAKGCDERFAGKYAWACSDWKRRLDRMGIKSGKTTTHFYSVWDGETQSTDHMLRRKSYENYELASQRSHSSRYIKLIRDGKEQVSVAGHTQSPIGIINFSYEYTIL